MNGTNGVSPTELPRGNTGNTAPKPAGDNDGAEPDAPGADPFAPLTDADRAAAAAIPAGGGGEAGDDGDVLELRPCPERNPPRHGFKHWQRGEPSGVWIYRTAEGAPVVGGCPL